ncbi:FliI/YscN family ATPase [Buchnera aphidicola]|uniref:FliI/YscN family ATPase n=1 Tax=Buchnera aphidicola TaxID=9 RepID=UPI003BEEDBAA
MNIRINQWLNQLSSLEKKISVLPNIIYYGRLTGIHGLVLEAEGLKIPIGAKCIIERRIDDKYSNIIAQVISFKKDKISLLSFDDTNGIFPGARVFPINNISLYDNDIIQKLPLGYQLLGRILDSTGKPLDNLSQLNYDHFTYLGDTGNVINPLKRKPIIDILDTGIRAINSLLTIGRGQRIGIFASSGVGKSVLLGMMAKYTQADIIVIGLIGERGREVKEFIENILGKDGLLRSVIIAAPADVSPILQVQGASYATSIAEYFRKQNKHVLLIMDSLTRYAIAQREIALSMGELPVSKGYPSSVFSKIPHLIERSGNNESEGSITAFYTILTEDVDESDPVSYFARAILDGHIILSRYYADLGHYPAIDIELSISRVMQSIISKKQYSYICNFKKLLGSYQRNRDLVSIGAYVHGTDLTLDHAIKIWPSIEKFLQQKILEKSDYFHSCQELENLLM